jgi:hypothetical protein
MRGVAIHRDIGWILVRSSVVGTKVRTMVVVAPIVFRV